MSLTKLRQDIKDRLLADTGSGGLFNATPLVTAAYNSRVPEAVAYPYIAYSVTGGPNVDAFNTRSREVTVEVHVFVEDAQTAYEPMARGGAILDRLLGDWHLYSSRIPTYGLDRWTPTLTGSGWTASLMTLEQEIESHDLEVNVYHWIQTYRVYVSRPGA